MSISITMNDLPKDSLGFPILEYLPKIKSAIDNDCIIEINKYRKYVSRELVIEFKLTTTPKLQAKAELKDRFILISESYLAYLWTIVYFFSMLYEKSIIPQNNSGGPVITNYDAYHPFLSRGEDLFVWGYSLRKKQSFWPKGFPPKEGFPEEITWGAATTKMWIKAICFCIYHEIGHIALDHWPSSDTLAMKKMEEAADIFACDAVFHAKALTNRKDQVECFLGVMLLTLSNFPLQTKGAVCFENHIDLTLRVENILKLLNFTVKEEIDYFFNLAATMSDLYIRRILKISPKYLKQEYKSALDYWNDIVLELNSL